MKAQPTLDFDHKHFPADHLATCVLKVCERRGVNLTQLINGTGIFLDDIKKANLLSANQLLRLLANAQKLTSGDDCSFQIGHQLALACNTQQLKLLYKAKTLPELMTLLSSTSVGLLFSPFVSFTDFDDPYYSYYPLQQRFGCDKQFQFIMEIYCTAISAITKQITGQRSTLQFLLPYSAPRHTHQYYANLSTKVFFDQPIPLIGSTAQQANSHSTMGIKKIASKQPKTLLDTLRIFLRTNKGGSLTDAATFLIMSPATLKRKLKYQGTHFKQIHDEMQIQDAIYYMILKGFTNEQSAREMSFSDLPNFRRAVKRCTGYTPQQLRRQLSI